MMHTKDEESCATGVQTLLEIIDSIIEGFRAEDMECRLECAKQLPLFAKAIGPVAVRTHLLPFLASLEETEELVLTEFVSKLSDFISLIGGVQYVDTLFPFLTTLATHYFEAVRNHAIQVLEKIFSALPSLILMDSGRKFAVQLSQHASEAQRILASSVVLILLDRSIQLKLKETNEIAALFCSLCEDTSLAVKRICVINLPAFYELLSRDSSWNEIVLAQGFQLLNQFIKPDLLTDSIRVAAVYSVFKISDAFLYFFNPHGIRLIRSLSMDPSWCVRWAVAENIAKFSTIRQSTHFEDVLFPIYRNLIKDDDPNVQSIAIRQLSSVLPLVQHAAKELVIICDELRDEGDLVTMDIQIRLAIVDALIQLPASLGIEQTKNVILQFFSTMLLDDNYYVRCKLLEGLPQIIHHIGSPIVLHELQPSLTQLAVDANWRIRAAVFRNIKFFFSGAMDKHDQKFLFEMLSNALYDAAASVRKLAGEAVLIFAETKEEKWIEDTLVPKLQQLFLETRYALRVDLLRYLEALSDIVSMPFFLHYFEPLLSKLVEDSVANVRVAVTKTLYFLQIKLKSTNPQFHVICMKWLEILQKDTDSDVRYYSKLALSCVNEWPTYSFPEESSLPMLPQEIE